MTRIRDAVVANAAITLLAGLVGADWYGFPFVWPRNLVVAPQFFPRVVDATGLFYFNALRIEVLGVTLVISMARVPRGGLG